MSDVVECGFSFPLASCLGALSAGHPQTQKAAWWRELSRLPARSWNKKSMSSLTQRLTPGSTVNAVCYPAFQVGSRASLLSPKSNVFSVCAEVTVCASLVQAGTAQPNSAGL